MNRLSRRTFLRGAGVCLALPLLEAMLPARIRAAGPSAAAPKRIVAINVPLGFIPEKFFPIETGASYALSDYLQPAELLRNDFTLFSGTSHPGVDGGHSAEKSFLTAAPSPGARTFRNTISLDQFIARQIGDETRFSSLSIGESLSWSANGVSIPSEHSPARTFARLFLAGTPKEVSAQERDLEDGRSIMDTVLDDAHAMERSVSAADRTKLDQFFTAVRETEQRLVKAQAWSKTPKPKVDAPQPGPLNDTDLAGTYRAQFDVIRLAFETDLTRVIAFGAYGYGLVPKIQGVELGYHGLTHHGKNPDMMRQLELIDRATLAAFFEFLTKMKASKDGDGSLLDHTQVLLGSNLGNANAHSTTNLPVILAGGGYRHGQHLAFDAKDNYPLPNLFVSMLQRMGIEADKFATSTGTMKGLEMRG